MKIYVLVDPTTNHVRYVGKTSTTTEKRLRGHIEKSRNLDNKWHVAQWIRSLTAEGLHPIIEVVREVEPQYVDETEIFCIAEYLRLGCDLTNNTLGGDGGVTGPTGLLRSAEALRKRSETVRATGVAGNAWRGKKQPPEVVAARMAGYTPEKRKAAAEKQKVTKARRKAVANAFGVDLYHNPNPDRTPTTEEMKEHLRKKAKEQWANYSPEEYETQADNLRVGAAEFRRKIKEGEIVDPRLGGTPWNKGIDQGPEVGLKSWETKRANGFVSQKDMLKDIAEKCGHSHSKVDRTLKGYSDKVSEEAKLAIWSFYIDHAEEYPKLTTVADSVYYDLIAVQD